MTLVLIILSALIGFGAALSAPHSAPPAATITVLDTTTAPVVAPLATATDEPTPAPYDIVTGSGPSH